MKKLIIITLAILIMATPVYADEGWIKDTGWWSWDKKNTELHVPLTLLMIVDLGQSTWAQEHWWSQGITHENNQFIGKYPSKQDVRQYFALSYLATTGLTYTLPPKWSHGFQAGVITIEIVVTHHNYCIGIGIKI